MLTNLQQQQNFHKGGGNHKKNKNLKVKVWGGKKILPLHGSEVLFAQPESQNNTSKLEREKPLILDNPLKGDREE